MSRAADLAVDCRHLTHRYGDFTAVDDFTLQVSAGETMGLLGPNGAGKTTVVRVLTTLTPAQTGDVFIFGLDSRRQTMDVRYNIGYVPQQLSIEPMLSGRQNVEWFARLYDVPRRARAERVDQALDAMHLLDVAEKLATTYSGGHGETVGTGAGIGESAVAADSGRTHRRPRSPCAGRSLGQGGGHAGRLRHDRAADHALHGRG